MRFVYTFDAEDSVDRGVAIVSKPLIGNSEIVIHVAEMTWITHIESYTIGKDKVRVSWVNHHADKSQVRGECLYNDDSEYSDEVIDNIFRHVIADSCREEEHPVLGNLYYTVLSR